jgi:hypothetical protein
MSLLHMHYIFAAQGQLLTIYKLRFNTQPLHALAGANPTTFEFTATK